jgi:hypothetical protein
LKEKNIEKQKEYNLHYLLAEVPTIWGKASDRLRQRANKHNKNRVGRLPTSEWNRKITLSDKVRRRIGKGTRITVRSMAMPQNSQQMVLFDKQKLGSSVLDL